MENGDDVKLGLVKAYMNYIALSDKPKYDCREAISKHIW